MQQVGVVAQVRRYPVKSLVGEALGGVEVEQRGLRGDRAWAVADADGKLGSGKSTRRFRRMDGLLRLAAAYDGDEAPVVTFPDGRRLRAGDRAADEALSDHVGRAVQLRPEGAVSHFDESPVHLVTTASLEALRAWCGDVVAVERFRPNVVIDECTREGLVEDGWVGRRLAVGPALVVGVRKRTPRCVMVTMPQVGLPRAAGILPTIVERNDGTFGVQADVIAPGAVTAGDRVVLLD